MGTITAVTIVVFWATFFGALSAERVLLPKPNPVNSRLNRLFSGRSTAQSDLLVNHDGSHKISKLRQTLHLAGLHQKKDLDRAVYMQRTCRLIPFVLVMILFFMGFPTATIVVVGIALAVIFIIIPRFLILRVIMKRRREMQRFLPDSLDLLTLCLEAGLSFDASLIRVAEEQERVCKDISQEFRLTNQEILTGESHEQALKNLAWRTGVEDIQTMVSAILQSLKLGTSLVKTLRTQSEVIRKKRRERIRGAIMKMPVKLIFPLLFFIFPTLLMIILGPSLINIFRELRYPGF